MNNNFVQVDKKELAHIIGGRNSYDYIDSGQFSYDIGCTIANTKFFKRLRHSNQNICS